MTPQWKPPNCNVCFSDGDGNIDLLLPVCTTDYCEESHIYVYSSGQVHVHLINIYYIACVAWQFKQFFKQFKCERTKLFNTSTQCTYTVAKF